jgi:hypothetical protein
MKNIVLLFLSVVLIGTSAFAQVRENKIQMSLGLQNGLYVSIPDVESKVIQKQWKNYTKNYGKLVKNKNADEQILESVTIPSINADNKMDIYAIFENNGLTAFFDLKTAFLNSTDHPKEFAGAKDFMQQFSYTVQREIVKEELEDAQDLLKKYTRKMADLVKDNKGYHEDIEDAKAKIKKAENNIIGNEKDQEQMKAQISGQTKTVDAIQAKLNKIGKSE